MPRARARNTFSRSKFASPPTPHRRQYDCRPERSATYARSPPAPADTGSVVRGGVDDAWAHHWNHGSQTKSETDSYCQNPDDGINVMETAPAGPSVPCPPPIVHRVVDAVASGAVFVSTQREHARRRVDSRPLQATAGASPIVTGGHRFHFETVRNGRLR